MKKETKEEKMLQEALEILCKTHNICLEEDDLYDEEDHYAGTDYRLVGKNIDLHISQAFKYT